MDISHASAVTVAVRKLMRVVSAAPKMEEWIGQVCSVAYGPSSSDVNLSAQCPSPPLLHLLNALQPTILEDPTSKVGFYIVSMSLGS